jgi:hypothetical protein
MNERLPSRRVVDEAGRVATGASGETADLSYSVVNFAMHDALVVTGESTKACHDC